MIGIVATVLLGIAGYVAWPVYQDHRLLKRLYDEARGKLSIEEIQEIRTSIQAHPAVSGKVKLSSIEPILDLPGKNVPFVGLVAGQQEYPVTEVSLHVRKEDGQIKIVGMRVQNELGFQ